MKVTSMEEMFSDIKGNVGEGKPGQILTRISGNLFWATIVEETNKYIIYLDEKTGKKYKAYKLGNSNSIEIDEEAKNLLLNSIV